MSFCLSVFVALLGLQSQFGFGAPLPRLADSLDLSTVVPISVIEANLRDEPCEEGLLRTPGLRRRALNFFRRQEWGDALVALLQLSSEDPQPYYLRLVAEIYLTLGQPARAVAAYKQALVSDRNNTYTWFGLWKAETRAKNFPGAYNAAKRLAQLRPDDVAAQTILAQSLHSIRRGSEGLAVLMKARETFPDDDGVIRVLIRMQIQEGLFEEALSSSRELLSRIPEDEYAQRMLAMILKILRRYDELREAARDIQFLPLRAYYEATAALGSGFEDRALSILSNLLPELNEGNEGVRRLVLWKLAEVYFSKRMYLRSYQTLVQLAQQATQVDLFIVAGLTAIQRKHPQLVLPPFLQTLRRQVTDSRLQDCLEEGSPFLAGFSNGSRGARNLRIATSGFWELGQILYLLPVNGLASRVAQRP